MLTSIRRNEINAKITSSTNATNMNTITLGIVVDTNDPQQNGRVRVVCQRWGDSINSPLDHIPWAMYSSPFGGQLNIGSRGPGIDETKGGVAYGMWAIPKVGAQVLVICIDNDPNQRAYIGSVYDMFTAHTLPHGRFMYDTHPLLDGSTTPTGPLSSTESPIEPLSSNLKQAFNVNNVPKNKEWQTRAADYTATAVDVGVLNTTYSSVPDDKDVKAEGWTSTQGYQTNRQLPNVPTTHTSRNLDSMVYSFTSPGFHSMSMDDRIENCRLRLRTTAGHQIIMDDTNERIYISTAQGNNWVELDQNGNIDVFSSNTVNIRSSQGVNVTSDADIRLHAKNDIHMFAGGNIHLQSTKQTHVVAGNELNLRSEQNMNLLSGGDMLHTASPNIHFNGPQAASAESAKWTHRVPTHEPFARTMTKNDYTHESEFNYDDERVNRMERGKLITRGLYWRR